MIFMRTSKSTCIKFKFVIINDYCNGNCTHNPIILFECDYLPANYSLLSKTESLTSTYCYSIPHNNYLRDTHPFYTPLYSLPPFPQM